MWPVSQSGDHGRGHHHQRLDVFFKIIGTTSNMWKFSGKFPFFSKVTRPSQGVYDGIYAGKVEGGDIKSELDKLVQPMQKLVDEERTKLGLS